MYTTVPSPDSAGEPVVNPAVELKVHTTDRLEAHSAYNEWSAEPINRRPELERAGAEVIAPPVANVDDTTEGPCGPRWGVQPL